MQRYDFYFGQKVRHTELDDAFDAVETAIGTFLQGFGYSGIITGADVAENNPTPNFTVDVSGPALVYDQLSQKIAWSATQDVDCTIDENGAATAVVSSGNEKYLSIFAEFERLASDPRTDRNGATVFYDQAESFSINVVQGVEAPTGTAVKPSLRADQVLLGDVLITYAMTQIQNSDIDLDRAQYPFDLTGSPTAIKEKSFLDVLQAMLDVLNAFDASTISCAAGSAWHDGTTNPTDDIEARINKIITDLIATAGSDRIGSVAISGSPSSFAAGSIKDQLVEALGFINSRASLSVANTWSARQTLSGNPVPIRLYPRSSPTLTDNGDISYDSIGSGRLIVRIGGSDREIAQGEQSRNLYLPLNAGVPSWDGSADWWVWNNGSGDSGEGVNYWESKDPDGNSYFITFGLNGFIPQNSTLTQISVYVYPQGSTSGTDRLRVRLIKKGAGNSANSQLGEVYHSGGTTPETLYISSLTEVLDTANYYYFIVVRTQLTAYAAGNRAYPPRVTFTDGAFARMP
jgi:hypothetical protein